MKKVLVTTVLLIGMLGYSQRGQHFDSEQRGMKDMTPEQIAILKTKKMTLALDLSDAQQMEIQKINLENAIEREALMLKRKAKNEKSEQFKPSTDERFEFQNERLDRMIAQKGKMKQILSEEQFQKWERIHHHGRNHKKDGKREHDSGRRHGK
ncbi:hypothetical protein [uncultured Eudoraea sp.]|uniref:hypothetical protein n=1 Tax=uncultured Eudoraea sp. TaxID=1035614 RepID=UPI00262A64F7|nr:hypothetical protein [uncultured Eudoraea sp.]